MSDEIIHIQAGPFEFLAKWHPEAPKTVAMFKKLLPYTQKVIHVRWSGEGVWVPLGDTDYGVEYENHTAYPARGDILLYPGGISETELIWAYGSCQFACRHGVISGNHFLTVVAGQENLMALGKKTLWDGAQEVVFSVADKATVDRLRPKVDF